MDGLYSKCINTYAITTLCLLFIKLAITLTVMSPPTTTSILFSILCRFMTLSQLSQFQFEVATQQNAKKKKKKLMYARYCIWSALVRYPVFAWLPLESFCCALSDVAEGRICQYLQNPSLCD